MYQNSMHYVYILKLSDDSNYTGYSPDVQQRLNDHNQGKCLSTKNKRPVELVWYCAFKSKTDALAFERYLKSGSGTAFRHKRLVRPKE